MSDPEQESNGDIVARMWAEEAAAAEEERYQAFLQKFACKDVEVVDE